MKKRLNIILFVLFGIIGCSEAQIIGNRLEFSVQVGYDKPIGIKEVKKNVNGDYSYAEPILFSNMQGVSYGSLKLNYKVNKVFEVSFRYDSPKTFSDWSSQANQKYQNSSIRLKESYMIFKLSRSFGRGEVSIGFLSGLTLVEYKNKPSNYWIKQIKPESESIPPKSLEKYNSHVLENIVSPNFGAELGIEFYVDQNFNIDLSGGYSYRVVTYSNAFGDEGFQSLFVNLGLCFRLFKDKRFMYR